MVTDDDGNMTRIVEKPSEPISRLANIGLYYIRDWETLFAGIDHTLAQPPHKGEWFLTDAFQYMIDHGKQIRTAEVGGWYDCGKVETVLETNRHLLEHGRGRAPSGATDVSVVGPVRVDATATVERSTIGPNVTIEGGAVVRGSTLEDCIIGAGSRVIDSTMRHCLVGSDAEISGANHVNMVITHDAIGEAP